MADAPKQTSPQENSNSLPGGAVPMEDYYMPDPNEEDLKDAVQSH
jgi:hypothetical protein